MCLTINVETGILETFIVLFKDLIVILVVLKYSFIITQKCKNELSTLNTYCFVLSDIDMSLA